MNPIYTLQGTVQHGNGRGKELGYPTINFSAEQNISEGVYLSRVLVAGKWFNSLTFIGEAKTFDEKDYLAETYLLDFHHDIYGQTVTVTILKKLRGNIKFPSVHELIEQMKKDEEEARKFFLSNSHNTNV